MRSKLRVAIVTESFLPQVNGVTNSVLRILESFSREGHQAMVIAPESADAPHEYAGFRVKRVPSISVKGLLPVGMPQKTIKPLIDGFQPDVIHLASPFFLGKYVAKIAQDLEIPTLSILSNRCCRLCAPLRPNNCPWIIEKMGCKYSLTN